MVQEEQHEKIESSLQIKKYGTVEISNEVAVDAFFKIAIVTTSEILGA